MLSTKLKLMMKLLWKMSLSPNSGMCAHVTAFSACAVCADTTKPLDHARIGNTQALST